MTSKQTLNQAKSLAVKAMQRYLGACDRGPVLTQKKLYNKVLTKIDVISDLTCLDSVEVWYQVQQEAMKRGIIHGIPSKDW